jgi:hypothetical protein
MLVMTPQQAAATAQAIREARTLAGYVRLLARSSRTKLPPAMAAQAARLSAALHAMDSTKQSTA